MHKTKTNHHGKFKWIPIHIIVIMITSTKFFYLFHVYRKENRYIEGEKRSQKKKNQNFVQKTSDTIYMMCSPRGTTNQIYK